MKVFENLLNTIIIRHIDFVYKTSKITCSGASDLLLNKPSSGENFIVSFWHGESYCLYPLLKGEKNFILTTKDKRGDYITAVSRYFGYTTIRIPDNSEGGKHIHRIKKQLEKGGGNLVITLDGPLGPYHQPKEFPFFMGLILNHKLLTVSVTAKYKIILTRRWDNYIIPLPFNKLNFHFHEPIAIDRTDLKDRFLSKRLFVKNRMENPAG